MGQFVLTDQTSHSYLVLGGVVNFSFNMNTYITYESFAIFFILSVLSTSLSAPQVQLQSKLPKEPIEDPATWAWGKHPNGLDYNAKNSLKEEQCLQDPCKLLGTPLCETTYFHCQEFKCIQTSEPCKKYCKILKTC